MAFIWHQKLLELSFWRRSARSRLQHTHNRTDNLPPTSGIRRGLGAEFVEGVVGSRLLTHTHHTQPPPPTHSQHTPGIKRGLGAEFVVEVGGVKVTTHTTPPTHLPSKEDFLLDLSLWQRSVGSRLQHTHNTQSPACNTHTHTTHNTQPPTYNTTHTWHQKRTSCWS